MLIGNHNKNETKEHFELKQIAKYLLWMLGYHHIATEVWNCCGVEPWSEKCIDSDLPQKCAKKDVIDVLGARTKKWVNGQPEAIKIMGFEAKASLSDFRNGFCTACEYTYIIAPKWVIPLHEIPSKIGLVEVDLLKYKIGTWNGIWFSGIDTTIKAQSRLAKRFDSKDARSAWALEQFRLITQRATVENIFNNRRIEIMDAKPQRIDYPIGRGL